MSKRKKDMCNCHEGKRPLQGKELDEYLLKHIRTDPDSYPALRLEQLLATSERPHAPEGR
jgi:hypothetical protein